MGKSFEENVPEERRLVAEAWRELRHLMCACFGNIYTVLWLRFFLTWLRFFLPWVRFFPCFLLSCKANARVKPAKTGHCRHSSTLVVICVVPLLFVLFYVLLVCKCVLPPGDNPIAVNKYSISCNNRCTETYWSPCTITPCTITP